MTVEQTLLADMSKSITELEVALSILRPELRVRDQQLLGMGKNDKKKMKKQREKEEKLERELSGLGKSGKAPKKPRTRSAPDLLVPARSQSQPTSLREIQKVSSESAPPQPPHQVNGHLSVPPPFAFGPAVGIVMAHTSLGTDSLQHFQQTASKEKHHHKGLRAMFRKPSHSSGSTPHSSTPSTPTLSATPDIPPASTSRSQRSHSSSTSTRTVKIAAPPPQISSPFRPPNHPSSRDDSPVLAQLSLSLFKLRTLHTSLTALLDPKTPTGGKTLDLPTASSLEEHGLSFAGPSSSGSGLVVSELASEGVYEEGDGDERTPKRPLAGRGGGHERRDSTSSLISSVLSVWFDAEMVPYESDGSDEEDGEPSGWRDPLEIFDSDEENTISSGSPASTPSYSPPMSTPTFSLLSDTLTTSSGSTSNPSLAPSSPPSHQSQFPHPAISPSTSTPDTSFTSARTSLSPSDASTAQPWTPTGQVHPTSESSAASSSSHASSSSSTSTPIPEVEWRTKLPAVTPKDEGSLLGVLRKSVGKDMSQITMPVTFNEPLSLLQRLAEDVEYTDLLTLGTRSFDSIERIAHIAAFAVSGFAAAKMRSSRKPFNPMLGETYELVRPGVRFIAEKTSHHPPIMASHADGDGWEMWQTSGAKNRLAGMSLEIVPVGSTFVKILSTGETFTWTKPSSYVRNLVAGTKYVEIIGKMEIVNLNTGDACVLTFKEASWGGSGRNAVSGVVVNKAGKKAAWIDGKWDSKLDVRYGSANDPPHPLWKANEWPAHAENYYGWNFFTLSLNQLSPTFSSLLPTSDSRFNPSQRFLEEGDIDSAEASKAILEAKQRSRNKAREEAGEKWTPRWFEKDEEGEEWVFKDELYWRTRTRAKEEGREEGFEDLDLW